MRTRFPTVVAIVLVLAAGAAGAQPAVDAVARPGVAATRATGALRVDGALDEPDWAAAEPITDFRLLYVREGEAPAESTSVRVLMDGTRLVLGIWCGNRAAGPVRSSLAPRDQILDDDHIAVHLDPFLDRRRAYIFGVNAHGVQVDGILDGEDPDFTWDGIWQAEVKRAPDGWTAEIAIPFRTLRFPPHGTGIWGMWVRRQITQHDEVCSWPGYRQGVQGDIMLQAGDLAGITGIAGGGGIALQPYATTTHVDRRPDTASPWSNDVSADAGLDLEFTAASSFTVNATINPDFSQVEADELQIDVNQRFPLFFPEKRPFFLEGAEIFRTPLQLVHTRRIADPDYGGKVTGKAGAARIGAIVARDAGGGSLGGTFYPGPERGGFVGIGRVTFDLGRNSNIGVVATGRTFEDEDLVIAAVVPAPEIADGGGNSVVAADTRLQLAHRVFFTGQAAWSATHVDSPAVRKTRRISDLGYTATFRYGDGIRNLSLYQKYFGPDFVAASGFLSRVDARTTGFDSNFYVRPENAWLRSWQPILDAYAIHDHEGALQEWWASPMIDWAFQKQTTMHTMYVRSMERWQGRDYDLDTYIFRLENTQLRALGVEFEAIVGDGIFYGETDAESFEGWSEEYELEATARPSPRITSELRLARSRFTTRRDDAEVFDAWAIGANTTYQFTRELYARLYPQFDSERDHLDADLLVGYVLSPGRVLYLGTNRDYEQRLGRTRATERVLFFKASYVFQP